MLKLSSSIARLDIFFSKFKYFQFIIAGKTHTQITSQGFFRKTYQQSMSY